MCILHVQYNGGKMEQKLFKGAGTPDLFPVTMETT